ncbi:MAG: GH25 family lysozyme [bacterium]
MRRKTMRAVTSVAALLAVWGAGAGCFPEGDRYERLQSEAEVCPGGTLLEGIDVSYWQPNIDWNAVAGDGIVFAFIRVSDGDPASGGTYDTDFQTNWAAARAAGILRGVYQFFRPNQPPVAQADLLISEIGGAMTPGDLPPVIDMEATGGLSPAQVTAAMQQWIDRIETQLGVTPIIYTGKYFWQDNVQSGAYSSYPLWHAQYTTAQCPNIADQWTEWAFWQYTSSGSVAGIGGNCDRNVFNGDLAALQALTFGDPVCGDGYCTGGEDHGTCPQDCPECEPIPSLGRIVDDTDLCFEKLGNPAWWHPEQAGWDNSLYWTYCTDTAADTVGVWHFTFDEAGEYRIEAYTDGDWAESTQAIYQVRHNGETTPMTVDQSQTDGWTLVGDFQFAQGGEQWVRLEDLTGEPYADRVLIAFDALSLTRLDPPVQADGGVVGPDGGGQLDATVDASADATDPGTADGGCGCRSVGGDGGVATVLLWMSVLWLGIRQRRQRQRQRQRQKE